MTKTRIVIAGAALFAAAFLSSASAQAASVSETRIVANALISPQVKDAVAEFGDMVTGADVKVEQFQDLDVITLSGTVTSGDVACGTATLEIKKTSEIGAMGMGRVTKYTATVTKSVDKRIRECRRF